MSIMELPLEQSTPRRTSNVLIVDSEKQMTIVSPLIIGMFIEETPRSSLSTAWSIYLKIVLGATSLIVILIFSVFSSVLCLPHSDTCDVMLSGPFVYNNSLTSKNGCLFTKTNFLFTSFRYPVFYLKFHVFRGTTQTGEGRGEWY